VQTWRAHSDTDTNSYVNTYSNANADSNTNAHTDPYGYAHADTPTWIGS